MPILFLGFLIIIFYSIPQNPILIIKASIVADGDLSKCLHAIHQVDSWLLKNLGTTLLKGLRVRWLNVLGGVGIGFVCYALILGLGLGVVPHEPLAALATGE